MHLFTSKFIAKPDRVTEVPGSVSTPEGFNAAGVAAGLKPSGNLDLGLLASEKPCASAAIFTTNAAAAAPVIVCRDEIDCGSIQGIVVNSGSANACTGARGIVDARTMVKSAADALGIEPGSMAVASTGVIGVPLDMDSVEAGISKAAKEISPHGGGDFAAAIQTTDRIDKEGAVEVKLAEGIVRIGACAKGAGMIAPSMATMLAFITTDAAIAPGTLKGMLGAAASGTFNSVSVDGDMSTNDCVYMMANGVSGISIEPKSVELDLFTEALTAVCKGLAIKMVADGEGATKTVELTVKGAAGPEEAARVARETATSALVRTAFFGRDANWGRIMGAAGAALAGEKALAADIYYEGVCLALDGAACGEGPTDASLEAIMDQAEIAVTLDLKRGDTCRTMYFSDLTHDYVTLNAEYTT